MPIIDDRGRLFGRINVLDAAVLVVLLALMPIAFGTYLLFRTRTPTVTAVEPASVPLDPEMRIKLKGEHLRPLLRARIGDVYATGYLFENSQSVDVLFKDVPPGTYDLRLYDGVQPLLHIPRAVTVVERAETAVRVQLVGVFAGMTEAQAQALTIGQKFPPTGTPIAEIVHLGAQGSDARWIQASDTNVAITLPGAVQRAAILRVRCELVGNECRINNVAVGARELVALAHSGAPHFLTYEVRADTEPEIAEATVRFVAPSMLTALVQAGDADGGRLSLGARSATIVKVNGRQRLSAETAVSIQEGGIERQTRTADHVEALEAVLRVPVHPAPAGWAYKGQIVRAGAPFLFTTPGYTIRGSILKLAFSATSSATGTP